MIQTALNESLKNFLLSSSVLGSMLYGFSYALSAFVGDSYHTTIN